MVESVEEAIVLLQDASQTEHDREQAAHYLQHHVTPAGLQALVEALEVDEFSIRWAAAVALAAIGDAALRPLVTALASPENSARLREGALHVFHQSTGRTVHEKTGELQHVLRGIDADMRTMEAAYHLLTELNQSKR